MAEWSPKADLNDNDTADYEEVGLLGESLGLQWGGRFRLRDYCHFQFTGGLSLRELMAGQRPETDPASDPLRNGCDGESEIKPAICHGPEEGGLS
jgi:hypothetical protein